jgi:class 3 adenylate cyclase
LTKELGWAIVASSETIAAAGLGVVTGRSKELKVKGRREAVTVYEVTNLPAA